jgi:hypothetical protein
MDTAGIDVMRELRSTRLLPVVGIAGAVLALAIVLAFVTASSLVGFRLWPADPPPAPAPTLVLRDPAPVPASRPRRSARAPAEGSRGAPPRAGSAPARPEPATETAPPPRDPPAATDPSPGVAQPPPAPPRALPVLPPPLPPEPSPASAPDSRPLQPVGDLVDVTTTAVASTLHATTGALGRRTEPVSPVLATTVAEGGGQLADTVQGLGQALGGLLGSPAAGRPAAPAPPA